MLRRIRQELSLTQEEAARLVGTDVRTWRRYESGTVNASGFAIRTAKRRALLAALCTEFGVASVEEARQAAQDVYDTAGPEGLQRLARHEPSIDVVIIDKE